MQDEQNNKKSDSKNEESGTSNNQGSSYEGAYGVDSGLLDDMRAKAYSNYMQNKGANRSGVPKDSNNDGRDDKGKSKWNALTGRFNLSPSGSNKTSGTAGNAMSAPAKYENKMSNMNSDMSNISKTKNITQQTNTSKETQVTNETIKGQDKVNVKETRVYVKGNNNGNKK